MCFEDATPEQLKDLERRRDKTKQKWERLVIECRDMKAALGLDNPEAQTYYNRQFFDLVNADPEFARKYADNPSKMEAEMRGEDEQC